MGRASPIWRTPDTNNTGGAFYLQAQGIAGELRGGARYGAAMTQENGTRLLSEHDSKQLLAGYGFARRSAKTLVSQKTVLEGGQSQLFADIPLDKNKHYELILGAANGVRLNHNADIGATLLGEITTFSEGRSAYCREPAGSVFELTEFFEEVADD